MYATPKPPFSRQATRQTVNELAAELHKYYEPKKVVIAERFHFHRRSQGLGESIAEYVAELRKLTTSCAFGAYLNDVLRIASYVGEAIRRRLLTGLC